MSVLTGLEPKEVLGFFEEICGIPHGSGNVGQISDHLAAFARERGLFHVQDELKNIIMIKEATSGYEQEPAVILQGHMDMVAVKKPGCTRDMTKEGLDLAADGDSMYARGTSLGGDDGIAVAYIMALFDSDSIPHPRLEAVITVDEETGMDGARGIDLSLLKGRRLLNLDSEEEGILLTSCAGGARVDSSLTLLMEREEGVLLHIRIDGLRGGHSGSDIDKERANANVLMGRFLYHLTARIPVRLVKLWGGLADNAIPRQTDADIVIAAEDEAACREAAGQLQKDWQKELAVKDPDVCIGVTNGGEGTYYCVDREDTSRIAAFLLAVPNGVQAMSADVKGLVETSLNLGILELDGQAQELSCAWSVRSCVESAKQTLIDKVCAVTELAGGSYCIGGDYPGWAYQAASPLREKLVRVYERLYGSKPLLQAIHAGLECGILAGKIEGLDCISFGPDMKDIHTTEERLSISSTRRVWEYLLEVLKEKER